MGLFKRIFGICATKKPENSECWNFSSSQIVLDLTKAPEINTVSGAIRLEEKGLPYLVLVFQGTDKKYHAIINKCSHGGRRIDLESGQAEPLFPMSPGIWLWVIRPTSV